MTLCPADSELEAFARGGLPPARREAVATHVATCRGCAQKVGPLVAATRSEVTSPADTLSDSMLGETFIPPDKPRAADGTADTFVSGERSAHGSTATLEKGRPLDRYVVLELLGAGGMGEVYAAWDPMLDRKVALKLLRPDFQEGPRGEEFRLRLVREAQALARLSHPAVVAVHDVGLADGLVYLAMEFVDGQSLTAWLRAEPRGWRQILEVFLEAGEGLAAAHACGITHRDFKPDNVLISTTGRVRVMDFGLAHATGGVSAEPASLGEGAGIRRAITQPGMVLGTPAYMSPEALFGKPTDSRSDQFSFCVALFEALYGQRPFEGQSPGAIAVAIQGNAVRPVPAHPRVPRRIHQLLLKGLRAKPEERYQTLRALLVQLGRRKSERRKRVITGVTAGLLALALGVAVGTARRAQARCAEVGQRLAGVWDAPVRATAKAAFLATGQPWSSSAWSEVERRLDDYSAAWVQQRRAACEAPDEKADAALGQHLVCLSRRMADLEAVSQLFAKADAEVVERAVATAGALPSLESCTEVTQARRSSAPEKEELRAGLAAVKARLDAAKYQEALERAGALADTAARLDSKAALAEARILIATCKARLGDVKAADALLEDAILLASTLQEDELVARGWVERVGIAALGGGSSDEGERWAKYARASLERLGSPRELEAALANNLGVLAWSRGHFDQAIEAHTRALELRVRLFGPSHPVVARTQENLGADFKGASRFEEAAQAFRVALALEEKVLAPTHPAVAVTLNNLANVLRAKGDDAGARVALERALALKEQASGKDSLSVAVTLTNLGGLLADSGDLAGADQALSRALKIKEATSGADSLAVAMTLTNLAQVRRAQKAWNEAMLFDQRAYDIRRKRLGPAHSDLAYNLTGIGNALLQLGKPEAARPTLDTALALRVDPGPDRGETSLLLAKCLLGRRADAARARALLNQAAGDFPAAHASHAEALQLLSKLPAK